MSAPAFDPVIHPPTRLQVMAVLVNIDEAEFATLRGMTQVSDSVLSKHLAALVEAGYVKLRKATTAGRQRTWAGATRAGRAAFARHVDALKQLAGLAEAPAPLSRDSAAASG
ncbi:DNA-binding MarR family transcriptional regulator [Sphingomonas naasensis]|uniref:ArsR family transcriptional regulator n=1 Tax=Sphingomonas naasensis TaxID=1344951 RepID=A0A4S1WDL9_9SPHN|nr:transcriptional regulator [Sphingomonas naasensis]NIJ22361.1 DNA-binding MarR family transcriptional regulator [Sphingomonas naasensis]TGX40643.1 ArsR family transcriptional regulator [Sphingomonas naasensis]